jgi:hypothetical protein
MTPQVDLEERVRQVGHLFQEAIELPPTMHARVMAATTSSRARHRQPIVREVALAAALILVAGLLAFGVAKLRAVQHLEPVKTPPAKSQVVPWTAAPMVLFPESAQALEPSEVGPALQRTVTSGQPLLLPQAITGDYQAQVVVDTTGFAVDYLSSTHHAAVELASSRVALPSPGPHGSRKAVSFRNGLATYQVDDATKTAPRWLQWTESSQPYSLAADGLSEAEFWQVANSLQRVQPASVERPCRASDLHAAAGGGNGAGGQIFNTIVFSNISATPCQLDGTPALSLRTTSGHVLQIAQTNSPMPWVTSPPNAARMLPGSPEPQLHSTVEGQATVGFSVWDCPADPQLASLTIALSGGGTLTVPAGDTGYSWGGECEGNHVARLVVGPFTPTEPQQVWVENSALSITLKLPATVKPGTTLHYQVILTNASGAPFRFHECPSYTEDASRPGSKLLANYQLNCGGIGWLPPDGSVTFDMQLEIPAGTAQGPGYLRWDMRSPYGHNQAQAPLTIQ